MEKGVITAFRTESGNTYRGRVFIDATLATCTLLDKPSRRRIDVPLDYVGFKVADLFVVGYGMDHGGRYRNLPYIAALEGAQAP